MFLPSHLWCVYPFMAKWWIVYYSIAWLRTDVESGWFEHCLSVMHRYIRYHQTSQPLFNRSFTNKSFWRRANEAANGWNVQKPQMAALDLIQRITLWSPLRVSNISNKILMDIIYEYLIMCVKHCHKPPIFGLMVELPTIFHDTKWRWCSHHGSPVP